MKRSGMLAVASVLALVTFLTCDVRAQSATVSFGSPYQKPGDTGWWVPLLMQGFDGDNLQCVDFRVKRAGTIEPRYGNSEVLGTLEHGTYWGFMQGIVQTVFPAHPDSFSVAACKSTVASPCTNEGPEGWLLSVPVDGAGTVELTDDFRLIGCENDVWTLPRTVLAQPIAIPPDPPVSTARSTWARLKAAYR